MRQLISPCIEDFRRRRFAGKETVPCALTGTPLSLEESRVNHKPPLTINRLMKDWCEREGVDEDDVVADERLQRSWVAYYEEHAELRIISKGVVVPKLVDVIVSSVNPLDIQINPTLCSKIQVMDRHVVRFQAEAGTEFAVGDKRFFVSDADSHRGGDVLVVNAGEVIVPDRKGSDVFKRRTPRIVKNGPTHPFQGPAGTQA